MKKLGILLIAVVLALGALGVGYAFWTHDIYVKATVQTGDLRAEFTGDDVTTRTVADDFNVAEYTYQKNSLDPETLEVTIYDAYPSMTATIPFTVINSGTIPIDMMGIKDAETDLSALPANSSVVINGFEDVNMMYPGDKHSGTMVVFIPWEAGNPGFVESDLRHDPNVINSYKFSFTITATQFDAEATP